jgi:hypothetical protein
MNRFELFRIAHLTLSVHGHEGCVRHIFHLVRIIGNCQKGPISNVDSFLPGKMLWMRIKFLFEFGRMCWQFADQLRWRSMNQALLLSIYHWPCHCLARSSFIAEW